MPPLNIALIGLGTVGSGVARLLLEQSERISRRAGRPIEICRAVVRDLKKPRGVELPDGLLTTDIESVIDDPEIDVAVQLIGGVDDARKLMHALLDAGKDVVTANKALLCEHGFELFCRARELGRSISFEAAVAGGVPIINAVSQSLAANQILSIEAILNGTSNFILTEMLTKRTAYDVVLREAQELGYAEADPAMDVNGTDAAQKLVILTELAFGTNVPISAFPVQGIDTLDLVDLLNADELGYCVKLLAVVKLLDGQLEMHVQPTLVRADWPLAKVEGAFNMIAVEADAVGRTWFSGAGAGQFPTASAVVADLIDTAVGRAAITFPRLDLFREQAELPVLPTEKISRRYYLRFTVEDRPHVFAEIADILGRNGVSLASIIQHETPEPKKKAAATDEATVSVVVMTHRTTLGKLQAVDAELDRLTTLHGPRVRMPVAD